MCKNFRTQDGRRELTIDSQNLVTRKIKIEIFCLSNDFFNGKLKGMLDSVFDKQKTTIVNLIGENKSQGHTSRKKEGSFSARIL